VEHKPTAGVQRPEINEDDTDTSPSTPARGRPGIGKAIEVISPRSGLWGHYVNTL
jgi:hypothetical protein